MGLPNEGGEKNNRWLPGTSRLVMKRHSPIGNESVSILARRSKCASWIVRHLNIMTHCFSVRHPNLMGYGPKQQLTSWMAGVAAPHPLHAQGWC